MREEEAPYPGLGRVALALTEPLLVLRVGIKESTGPCPGLGKVRVPLAVVLAVVLISPPEIP